jgi:hypothetical protein
LSAQEVEVIRLILKGKFLKEIATALHTSDGMVRKNMGTVGRIVYDLTGEKFKGRGSYVPLARRAIELGLASEGPASVESGDATTRQQ